MAQNITTQCTHTHNGPLPYERFEPPDEVNINNNFHFPFNGRVGWGQGKAKLCIDVSYLSSFKKRAASEFKRVRVHIEKYVAVARVYRADEDGRPLFCYAVR